MRQEEDCIKDVSRWVYFVEIKLGKPGEPCKLHFPDREQEGCHRSLYIEGILDSVQF